jgi:F-type H+-transporting ATPase subunit delta
VLQDRASNRYAQAAFEIARDRSELAAWNDGLQAMKQALEGPGGLAFVESKQVPLEAKEELLRRVLGAPAPLLWNLVRLLASKGRLALLPQIAERFQELFDEERGIAHAQVVTAVAMTDAEREALTKRLSQLTGKQVDVKAFVEPDILGGLVVRIGDRLIDGSARTKLLALRRRLAGSMR